MPVALQSAQQANSFTPIQWEVAVFCCGLAVLPLLAAVLLFLLWHFNLISLDEINSAFLG